MNLTVGVVADDWKLPAFEKALTAAGFVFTKHPFKSKVSTLLKVQCAPGTYKTLAVLCGKLMREAAEQKAREN